MAKVATYLNFAGQTEEAFGFYGRVFGTQPTRPPMRYGDLPAAADQPPLPEDVKPLILHLELPILGGHLLMGSDAVAGFGPPLVPGNTFSIMLQTDDRAQTDRLFAALSEGGTVSMPLQDMFWGDYYGMCTDRFGVQWMLDCPPQG